MHPAYLMRGGLVIASLVAVDQLAKYIFLKSGAVTLGPTLLARVSPAVPDLAVVLPPLAALIVVTARYSRTNLWPAFIFIVGGAASNSLDVVRLGAVVDYIPLVGGLTANLADIYIYFGIILLIAMPIFGFFSHARA